VLPGMGAFELGSCWPRVDCRIDHVGSGGVATSGEVVVCVRRVGSGVVGSHAAGLAEQRRRGLPGGRVRAGTIGCLMLDRTTRRAGTTRVAS